MNKKKVSAANHEVTESFDNKYNENNLYQVENLSLDGTKEKIE